MSMSFKRFAWPARLLFLSNSRIEKQVLAEVLIGNSWQWRGSSYG